MAILLLLFIIIKTIIEMIIIFIYAVQGIL